ncbi:MAG: peptidylprolyl isomerase [Candidatus Curtissbacteria bacterium]|nr:peptidylprolyl isomerase [Candidatus Curtissbacteria bacterium]
MKNTVWIVIGVLLIAIVTFFVIRNNRRTEVVTVEQQPSPNVLSETSETTKSAMKKTYLSAPSPIPATQIKGKRALIKTNRGDIIFELFSDVPIAASNFIFLTNDGFYDGLTFHRREENFVIQGGDPSGNGTGGPGYKFADEVITRDYTRGIVAMANSGPNTNGSQFFIMLATSPLPKNYTIFGNVISGIDVVDRIQVGDVMEKVTIE